ncbi:MAG: hypothetical protein QGG10_04020, partial [Arenicellales bacterium]|nr:hypothetical protein [Arenicellales bacterium]
MASIRKRGSIWQSQVRRNGRRLSKSFQNRKDAQAWARGIEVDIERGLIAIEPCQPETTTLSDLIDRYLLEVTPSKRSADKESYRLRRIQKYPLAEIPVATLTPSDIARYRDKRLTTVGNQVVRHDLNVLGHMFGVAIREWNLPLTT